VSLEIISRLAGPIAPGSVVQSMGPKQSAVAPVTTALLQSTALFSSAFRRSFEPSWDES
jgi:hypothetical protein